MELRDQIKTRINFALNSSKKCVGCKYLNDCRWLKESGSWCGGKTEDVATILVAELELFHDEVIAHVKGLPKELTYPSANPFLAVQCSKFRSCSKIAAILDQDMLDSQVLEAIRSTCESCEHPTA